MKGDEMNAALRRYERSDDLQRYVGAEFQRDERTDALFAWITSDDGEIAARLAVTPQVLWAATAAVRESVRRRRLIVAAHYFSGASEMTAPAQSVETLRTCSGGCATLRRCTIVFGAVVQVEPCLCAPSALNDHQPTTVRENAQEQDL